MFVLHGIIAALLPALNTFAAAGAADGVTSFQIQQINYLDIANNAAHSVAAGEGLPACNFESFGSVQTESLDYFQFSCDISAQPDYFRFGALCDGGEHGFVKYIDIYLDEGEKYDAYCAGGDATVLGQCYWRCESTDCTTPLSGGVNIKLLDCDFEPCQC